MKNNYRANVKKCFKKTIGSLLVLMFAFHQSVPTSWAAEKLLQAHYSQEQATKILPEVQTHADQKALVIPVTSDRFLSEDLKLMSPTQKDSKDETPIPVGWTRAASNSNYAFRSKEVVIENLRKSVGEVMNLITGETKTLYLSGNPYLRLSPQSDVSPDGKYVIFGYSGSGSYDPSSTFVRRFGDIDGQLQLQGGLQRATFNNNGTAQVETSGITYRNGTELGAVYQVLLNNLTVSAPRYKLLTQASAVLDEGYLIIPEQNYYSNHFTVTLFDASQGTDQLVPIPYGISYRGSQGAGGSSGSGHYKVVDAYRTPSGKVLISVGISAVGNQDVDFSRSFILNPRTGQRLELEGVAATNVTYDRHLATYTLSNRDGRIRQVTVNLETLKIKETLPPPPYEWTLADSNPNFAFYEAWTRVGQYYRITLQLQDLRSGAIQNLSETMQPYSRQSLIRDVSPDGKTVIYGYERGVGYGAPSIHLQRIGDPKVKLVLNNTSLASIKFNDDNTVKLNNSILVDLKTLSQTLTVFDRKDVNRDGRVTWLDALSIINYLNARAVGLTPKGSPLLDVDGDKVVSSRDALLIINYLNAQPITPT